MSENKTMNWIPVIELAVLAFTCLGTTIGLFVHSDIKFHHSMEAMRTESSKTLEGIRNDMLVYHRENSDMMRDFHGRLCAIEERNKK